MTKLDPIDADNIAILLETPAWKVIQEDLRMALATMQSALESEADPAQFRYTQGMVAGLKRALACPQQLIARGMKNREG